MCKMTGFDIYYGLGPPTIEPHCCRKMGCTDGGMSLEEACEIVARWYEEQAKLWRTQKHADVLYFV